MPQIRQVLLVAHAHHDIGYTHSPRTILPIHWQSVREAIRLAGESEPDDRAAFRWTLENSRPVSEFLRHAEAGEIDDLVRAVRGDRISVTGGYVNSTELIGQEELTRSYEAVDRFRQLGLPVRVVQHSDINGLAWGTVPSMHRAGLDTLVMGLNPDHGRPPFEQPTAFWWEGPDGSRVLAWLSLHYGLGEMWGLLDDNIPGVVGPLRKVVDRLEARSDYPFDFVVLHATDDNGWPTRDAANGVRAWNEQHPELTMSTATLDQAMNRARAQAVDADLPVWRGEWEDWWAHGHGSSAYEVGVSRAGRGLIRAAETALAVARLEDGRHPVGERRTAWRRDPIRQRGEVEATEAVAQVYDDLLVFEEHTFSADESVRRPDSLFTRSHWNAKAAFAFATYDGARELAVEGLWRLAALQPAGAAQSLVVFNPYPEARTAFVVTETPEFSVLTETPESSVEVLVRDVPAFGLVRLPIPASPVVTTEPGSTLETERFRIVVDPARGGIVSLIDKVLGWDLIDSAAPEPLGAVIFEAVDPAVDHPVLREGVFQFAPRNPGPSWLRTIARVTDVPLIERGPGWAAISWSATAPTLPSIRVRATAYDGLDTLRLTVSLTKDENLEPEGVYVAFPFAIADPTFWLETAGAVYRAEIDQLPDTCRDWYSVQHAIGVGPRAGEGDRSVMWTTEEAPLVQLGEIHTGQWARHLEAPVGHIYSWLMNNLYCTNFRASQGGSMTFSYGIAALPGEVDAGAVRKAGERAAMPMLSRVEAGATHGSVAWLRVESPEVLASAVALEPDGKSVRIRLQASAHGDDHVRVAWLGQKDLAGFRADVFGHRVGPLDGDGHVFELAIAPNELATIVLEPKSGEAEPTSE